MHRAHTLLAALLPCVLAACSSAPPADQTVSCRVPTGGVAAPAGPALVTQGYGTTASPIPLNAVLFTDNALASSVAVQSLSSGRTEGGTVQVNVRLINCSDRLLVLRARTSFMAKSGAPTEAASAWQMVPLPAKATAVYAEKSLGREGVEAYLVEMAPSP